MALYPISLMFAQVNECFISCSAYSMKLNTHSVQKWGLGRMSIYELCINQVSSLLYLAKHCRVGKWMAKACINLACFGPCVCVSGSWSGYHSLTNGLCPQRNTQKTSLQVNSDWELQSEGFCKQVVIAWAQFAHIWIFTQILTRIEPFSDLL